jgi:transposase
MTLNRVRITAVLVENRPVPEVAARYGVSRSWLSELLARYLPRAGRVVPQQKKRPNSSSIRFATDQPDECW